MITSTPTSEARRNRGVGINHLGGIGEGACNPRRGGTFVFDETRKEWIDVDAPEAKKDVAMAGDYELMRDTQKVVDDYCRFKDKRDREKITAEFYGRQADFRKKVSKELNITRQIMEANNG